MRRFTISMLAVGFLFSHGVVVAEEPSKGSVTLSSENSQKPRRGFQLWLKDLKKRVAQTRARPNQLVAVAAVRGSEKDIAPKLYWKGKKSEGPVAAAELEDFEKAIDAALAGDSDAKSKLQAFVSSYPKSSLGPDARIALERLTVGQEEAKP